MKKCGIYKITSPTNRIYIGQSINIKRRFDQYRRIDSSVKSMIKLYNSLIKYESKNHIFEIIEECSFEELNNRERYWQEYYNVIGKQGLNCVLVDCSQKRKVVSQETRDKISKNNPRYWKGKKIPREAVEKAKKNRIYTEEYRKKIGVKSKGRIPSIETKEKKRQSMLGKKHTLDAKLKMSLAVTGRKHSEETKRKMSIAFTGRILSQESKDKVSKNSRSKEVLGKKINMYCFYTNNFLQRFETITEAAKYLDRPHSCIGNMINSLSKFTTQKQTKQKVIFTLEI